jgi:hypothetical protein
MMGVFFATTLFILLGMAPAAVSFFVERRPGSSGSTCILMFNLAGLMPVLGLVWGGQMHGGISAIGEMTNWLIIYGAAATGALVAWASPHFSALFTQIFSGSRKAKIKVRQQELYEEWGSSVVD